MLGNSFWLRTLSDTIVLKHGFLELYFKIGVTKQCGYQGRNASEISDKGTRHFHGSVVKATALEVNFDNIWSLINCRLMLEFKFDFDICLWHFNVWRLTMTFHVLTSSSCYQRFYIRLWLTLVFEFDNVILRLELIIIVLFFFDNSFICALTFNFDACNDNCICYCWFILTITFYIWHYFFYFNYIWNWRLKLNAYCTNISNLSLKTSF